MLQLVRNPRRRRRASASYLITNPSSGDLWLWGGAAALVAALVLWKRKEIIDVVKDVVDRGKRLTYSSMGRDGVVPNSPQALLEAAIRALGRPITLQASSLARMIRSEGPETGVIRAHVAINDAREKQWDVHKVLTYSTNSKASGWYGEQFTPAARAPGAIKSVRRYATTKDAYAGDVLMAEQALREAAAGVDITGNAVKFVDRSSMGVQEGSGSYEDLVVRWAPEGLRPFTLPGYSDDLVVFRRVG